MSIVRDVKANLHGTIFAYDCRMRFFIARCSRHGKIVYNFHDIRLVPMASIVVGF